MKKLLLTVALALCLTACAGQETTETTQPETTQPETTQTEASQTETTQPAETAQPGILSAFTAQDLQGNAVNQEILKGKKLTMVNVWATFCGPCINEMPDLGALAQEYADKGVQIVGLLSDANASDGSVSASQVELAQEIVDATGANYLHIIPGTDMMGLLYQITSVPTTFFVDETGKQVGTAYVGSRDKDAWAAIIDQMLEEVA